VGKSALGDAANGMATGASANRRLDARLVQREMTIEPLVRVLLKTGNARIGLEQDE